MCALKGGQGGPRCAPGPRKSTPRTPKSAQERFLIAWDTQALVCDGRRPSSPEADMVRPEAAPSHYTSPAQRLSQPQAESALDGLT